MNRSALVDLGGTMRSHMRIVSAQLSEAVLDIPVQMLVTSPLNPRDDITEDSLRELAASINEVGLIEFPVVRRSGEKFEVVAGERRVRAARLAGLPTVICVVRQLTDMAVIEHALVENHQRKSVHPLSEANSMAQLMTMDAGYSVARMATRLGVSQSWVYDRLRLRSLIPVVQLAFRAGAITLEHAEPLSRLKPETQMEALEHCFSGLLLGAHIPKVIEALSWAELARAVVSPAELRRWIAHHQTVDISDPTVQASIPDLADALEEADAERGRLLQVSEAEGLSTQDARSLGVVRRERWIEIILEGGERGPGKSRRRCESMQTVVVTHPADQPPRVIQACLKPSCEVHRPGAAPDPALMARRAKDKAWRAVRADFFQALAKRIPAAATPAIVKACVPQDTLNRLKASFGLSLTAETAVQALILASVPVEASEDDPRLVAVTKALGLTPEQWKKGRKRP